MKEENYVTAFVLLLILISASFGVMLHSIYVIGKGGMYPSKKILKKRLHISGGTFLGGIVLLLAFWII